MFENTIDQFEEAGATAVLQDEANLELGQVHGSGDYDRLIAQREELERRARQEREELEAKIQEARTRHLEGVVKEIQAKIAQFGLMPSDVFPEFNFSRKRKESTSQPKYRDPATGATWTGRGKVPAWIGDKDREQFAI
ncbi:H-NS histone family protein [Diaphorobacter sp. J5-51]|uniref:H-NS histone family protein n=1 Tax=Diaphorobacter sp. J5-51 TaxID=680496 RepID=UPI0009FC59A1